LVRHPHLVIGPGCSPNLTVVKDAQVTDFRDNIKVTDKDTVSYRTQDVVNDRGTRFTLEGLVNGSDVSSLIWERLALQYSPIGKKKQLNCLNQALLSEHDIATSDRLRKEILKLSDELRGT
jgi:hypothetical protein